MKYLYVEFLFQTKLCCVGLVGKINLFEKNLIPFLIHK